MRKRDEACPKCGDTACYAHCQENKRGGYRHEHDGDMLVSKDGGRLYLDTNCKHCGQSGSVPFVFDDDSVIWG